MGKSFVNLNRCTLCFKISTFFIQRSAADQSVMSSKFEVLGGELDEKRKLIEHGSVSSFFALVLFCV